MKRNVKSAEPCTPARARGTKRKVRRKKKPGQPDDSRKLCDRLREEICQHIRRGLSKEDASRLCGITRETLRQWRGRGEEEASGPYRQFAEDVELAELQAKDGMLQKLLRDKDCKWTWLILKARYPSEFREKTEVELAGPGARPLMPQNPFKIEVRLADSDELKTDFEISEPDGSTTNIHYDPFGLQEQRETRKKQKDKPPA
jgi:transposase